MIITLFLIILTKSVTFFDSASIDCSYYTDYQFLNTFHIHQRLFIAHFNCKGLPNNFDKISIFLNEQKSKFDVIAFSETRINTMEKLDSIQVPGYQLCHEDREEIKVRWCCYIHHKLY